MQNEESTRETLSTTSKCIDLGISTKKIKVGILKYKISDHYALRFPVLYDTKLCFDDNVNQFRDFSCFSKEDHHLKCLIYIDQSLRKCQCDTIESKLNYLTDVLNSADEKYASYRTNDATKKRSNWLTNHIKSLIKKRDKAHATYVEDASKKNDLVYMKQTRSQVNFESKTILIWRKKNRKRAQIKWNIQLFQPFSGERN